MVGLLVDIKVNGMLQGFEMTEIFLHISRHEILFCRQDHIFWREVLLSFPNTHKLLKVDVYQMVYKWGTDSI